MDRPGLIISQENCKSKKNNYVHHYIDQSDRLPWSVEVNGHFSSHFFNAERFSLLFDFGAQRIQVHMPRRLQQRFVFLEQNEFMPTFNRVLKNVIRAGKTRQNPIRRRRGNSAGSLKNISMVGEEHPGQTKRLRRR